MSSVYLQCFAQTAAAGGADAFAAPVEYQVTVRPIYSGITDHVCIHFVHNNMSDAFAWVLLSTQRVTK